MREGQNGRASTSRRAEAKTAPKTNVRGGPMLPDISEEDVKGTVQNTC